MAAAEQLLGLGSVVAHVLLGDLSGLCGVGASNLPKLLGLCSHDVLRILKVVVDQLLVGGVDQGDREQQSSGEERKSPVRDDLNEPVGEEGAQGNLMVNLSAVFCAKAYSSKAQVFFFGGGGVPTVAEAPMFSANRIRWDSMTTKLASSWTSPKRASNVSRGIV